MNVGTIWELVARAVAASPDATWLRSPQGTATYRDLDEQASRAAVAFLDRGVEPGDRVLFVLPNRPELVFAWLGLMKAGGVLLAANPAGTLRDWEDLAARSGARLALTDADGRGGVEEATAALPTAVVDVAELFSQTSAATGEPARSREAGDLAVLIATSGTTGRPKLVMQTHRAYVLAAEGFPAWLGLEPADRLLTTLPLFHLNAQVYSTLGSLAAGASLVLLPRFSARGFLDEARRYEATQFNAIGAMVEILLAQEPRPDDADTPLRLCYSGPAPPRERHREIERRFGLRLMIGYALSESTYGTVWPREGSPYGSMGRLRQHPVHGRINEGRIVDAGRDVEAGTVGELLLRNPGVMLGYYGDPEASDRALAEGWLRTGDLVRADAEGHLYFISRKKEVIRRRGENISPVEVEEVLVAHPAVAEVAVVGVASELTEQDVKAFVRAGAPVAPRELRDWCAARLAAFKVPRYLELVAELPHTPTGRVAKPQLPRERTPREHDLAALDEG